MDRFSGQPHVAALHHNSEDDSVKELSASITITCHCGAHRQSLQLRRVEAGGRLKPIINFCDCGPCRHSSGTLLVSYLTVLPPRVTDGLSWFDDICVNEPEATRRWFCTTCGCHLFKNTYKTSSDADGTSERVHSASEGDECRWSVATGVIIESPPGPQAISVTPTRSCSSDGGILKYVFPGLFGSPTSASPRLPPGDLQGSCACGQLQIMVRPASESDLEGDRSPWSPYSDLLEPFARTPSSVLANAGDEKWWIRTRSGQFRYLAGTCACRSCRLITGFEIQTWAFIPRKNISIYLDLPTGQEWRQLDTNYLGAIGSDVNPLSQYESSPDVFRHFCSRCGATVFWRNLERPDVVDVSAGLFTATDGGARAESHLEWWKERVSFIEDSENGRDGWVAHWAGTLTANLQKGLGDEHESITPLP